MRLLIGFALLGLAALAGALLAAGAGAQQRSLTLEERTPSSLTVTWSWDAPPAAAFELAWRARGDDDETAWRTIRKAATDRRHTISELDAGLHYVVRLRGLNAADRPIHDLRGIFATSWSAPRLLRLLASRDGALTVGWSQPGDWNPHGWRLSWRVAGSQTPGGTIDLPAAARSRRIDGLSRGTDHLIRLSALNARGGESPAQTIRATASAATLETPKLTALSWSGLTIRAEWDAVPRADGYDLFWRAAEERGGAVGRLSVTGTSAEFDVPAGAYWVELRARRGEGRTARRSDRTQPRNIILLPAPDYLRVQSFDGEQARLAWPGADVPEYDLEWGRGGTKQTETRDGRSGLIEVGPLEGGNTYEFRVRARNDLGRSGWSPTAALSPTIWPQRRPLAALDTDGSLYALWPPAAGAEWYEAQWVNAADPAETARVRVGSTPNEGGSLAARIPRDGGFEDGRWLVRVRAGPWGTWSIPHALDLAGQPPRLSLALESSRELCTAGTLTEISWQISGGSAPYALSIENSAVDVSAENVRINCGALTETEAADEEAALAAKTVTAVVTDSRGVRRQASLDVQRARALLAPTNVRYGAHVADVFVYWDKVEGAGSQSPTTVHPVNENRLRVSGVVRTRANRNGAEWSYYVVDRDGHSTLRLVPPSDLRVLSVAAVRHPLELETPAALNWSEDLVYTAMRLAQNVTLTATHDTVTVSWDRQPYAAGRAVWVHLYTANDVHVGRNGSRLVRLREEQGVSGRHEVTFAHLPADIALAVLIVMGGDAYNARFTTHPVRTQAPPPDWTAPPSGPQNLRYAIMDDVLTIYWDEPYPSAESDWYIAITNPTTGRTHYTAAYSTSWTWPSRVPNQEYRVTVTHGDIMGGASEITVSPPSDPNTPNTPTDDVSLDEMRLRSFFPIWPVLIDERYAMTDDPFQWRTTTSTPRFHGGLDMGEYSTDAGCFDDKGPTNPPCKYSYTTRGDPVYAATEGTLRVFADNLVSATVFHCPSDDPLHEQFYVKQDVWGSLRSSKIESHPHHDEHAAHKLPLEDVGHRKGIFCQGALNRAGGRTALVTYERGDGLQIVTKYGHLLADGFPRNVARMLALNFSTCDPALAVREPCELDPTRSMLVQQGDQIASIGTSGINEAMELVEDAGFDAHVHFEIWSFDIPPELRTKVRPTWYRGDKATYNCDPVHASDDCVWWREHGPRTTRPRPVLDVEAYLPPLPASPSPTAAREVHGTLRPARAQHLVKLDDVEVARGRTSVNLTVVLSVAFWRPLFYSQYYSNPTNPPGTQGQITRAGRAGIASTGPGVDAYYTHLVCGESAATHSGPHKDDPTAEGETARALLTDVALTLGVPCTVIVRASNEHWEEEHKRQILNRAEQNIALRDPAAAVTWQADLPAGINAVHGKRTLQGDALHLYTFTARRDYTYKFCAYPANDRACSSESTTNVAELLIMAPGGTIAAGPAPAAQGLTWEVPDNGPANQDYVLVVRRHVRTKDSYVWATQKRMGTAVTDREEVAPDYAYTLKYTVPPIGVCDTLRLTLGAFLFVCTPPEPIGLSTTTTDDTITATVTPSAGALEIEFKRLPAGADCTTTGSTVTVAVSASDAASGATGAANKVVSPPFGGLTPATTYKLCARAVRTIETGFTLHSDWTSTEAATTAAPPDEPGGSTCTPDNSTKPSTTQTVTSTETRWTMSGVYEYEEERTKSQRQTRSVSWECATSTWTRGAWGDSGAPTYGSWSATGDERCTDPYAAKPAETKTETVTEDRWVLRGATAYEQKRTGTAHYSRTVTKTGPRACGWTLGEWGSPDRTSWGMWADTGTSEERPVSSETEDRGNGTVTRWIVGSSSACEEIEQLQRRRTRSVRFSASNGWTTGSWSVWGAPYRAGWARTGTCPTKPADRTRTVSTQVDTEWRVGSSEACEWTQYSDQPQTKRAEWSDDSESWLFGGDEDWVDDGAPSLRWAEPDSCVAKPADKTVTVTEQQIRLGPQVFTGTSFCVRYPEQRSRSAYYYQPYVWDASATAWELGERAATPYSYSAWTAWTRTGERPQPCAFSALPSGSWSLESGDYELEWSAQRVLFTVPDDASVELSWRARDGGGQEAVFSIAGEGELAVHPDSLGASSGAASGESSERPTLNAIEDSLTLVEASAD